MGGRVPRGEPKKLAPGWVGGYPKSRPNQEPRNAIIADLAMPVMPAPRGARTWVRGVLVVGDRRTVGDPRIAVGCAGQHGRPRRTTREALPPCDSGRHPVCSARWYRVAATAGGVPASRDGARGGIAWRQLPVEFPPAATGRAVFARWARGGAWQRILDALRDRPRVPAGRDRCPTAAIIDSQTMPAADTVPRSSRGWDGGTRTNGVKRHLAVEVNGLLLVVVVTAASIPDRDAAHRLLAALRGRQVIGVDRVYCATPFNETWESVIGTLMMHAIAEAQSSSSEVSMTKRSVAS